MVTANVGGVIRVWDVATGRPIGKPATGRSPGVTAVGVAEMDGRPLVVFANEDDAALQVHDLATGTRIRPPLVGHTNLNAPNQVTKVLASNLNGRPVIVSGSNDSTIRVWDLAAGTPIVDSPMTEPNSPVSALAIGELDGQPVIVSGRDNGTIHVRDLATGMLVVDNPTMKQSDAVSALGTGKLGGRPVIVSVDRINKLVEVWDFAHGTRVGLRGRWRWRGRSPITKNGGLVLAVAVGEVEGRLLVAAGDSGGTGTVRVWDSTTGKSVDSPPYHSTSTVTALAVTEVDRRPLIVSGHADGTIRAWDSTTGKSTCSPPYHHLGMVNDVAVFDLNGEPMIVSAGSDGLVQLCHLATFTPIGNRKAGNPQAATAVAVAEVDGRPVIVYGSRFGDMLWLWDVGTGQPLPALPLGGYIGAICARGPFISIGAGNALIVIELGGVTT